MCIHSLDWTGGVGGKEKGWNICRSVLEYVKENSLHYWLTHLSFPLEASNHYPHIRPTWNTRLPRRKTPIRPLFENQGKSTVCTFWHTRNFLTFVNTTAIACYQNIAAPGDFLPVCNSSRVYKRQKITSKHCHKSCVYPGKDVQCSIPVRIKGRLSTLKRQKRKEKKDPKVASIAQS